MQRIARNSPKIPRPRPGQRKPLRIVLVYDGFTGLIRAYEFWSGLVARFKNEIQIVCSTWNFNVPRKADFRPLAALRRAGGNIIVLSAGGESKLPAPIRNCISACLPWRKRQGDALVAVLAQETPLSASAARLRKCLRQIAEQTGVAFFCTGDKTWPGTEAAPVA